MNQIRSINSHWLLCSLLLSVLLGSAATVRGQVAHGFALRIGRGTTLTEPVRRSIFIARPMDVFSPLSSPFSLYLDPSIAVSEKGQGLDLIAGVTPMARWELRSDMPKLSFDVGVGMNILTSRSIGQRQLGSNVLFSPTVCTGVEIPWTNGVVGIFYMFRHLSNASMFEDNDGINYQYIVFSVSFGSL